MEALLPEPFSLSFNTIACPEDNLQDNPQDKSFYLELQVELFSLISFLVNRNRQLFCVNYPFPRYSKPIAPISNRAPTRPIEPSCSPNSQHASRVDINGSNSVAMLATVADV